MDERTVDLTINLTPDVWETLVELSQAMKNKTVAETVEVIILLHLKPFMYGRLTGLNRGSELAQEAMTKALDRVISDLSARAVATVLAPDAKEA
jgi:hypothetical protein